MLEISIVKSNPKVIEEIKITRNIVIKVKSEKGTTTEYSISDESHNDILRMIKHQASSFEETSKFFESLVKKA